MNVKDFATMINHQQERCSFPSEGLRSNHVPNRRRHLEMFDGSADNLLNHLEFNDYDQGMGIYPSAGFFDSDNRNGLSRKGDEVFTRD